MKFPSREFDNAVAALCHGSMTDETVTELHELLRENLTARDEYLWRLELHGELASGQLDLSRSVITDDSGDDPLTIPAVSRSRSFPLQVKSLFAVVTTLTLVFVVGGSWLWWNLQSSHVPQEVFAQFSKLEDSRWMNSTTTFAVGDSIREGQRIELSSGVAEVRFESGAILTLAGPAVVEPLSKNSAFLMLGEVQVVAGTEESIGFTLETQNSKFIDIGTAFTAAVTPDGLSGLEVSEGEVDVLLDGVEKATRVRAGESMFVEPGEQIVVTRIERGDGTSAFRFPTIESPSRDDYADMSKGLATVQAIHGNLMGASANVLLDGVGQSHQDAPEESAFFGGRTGGFLIDLGQDISISKINCYSWHQHATIEDHRHRARQRFTVYGFAGDELPELMLYPDEAGWTRIARVNSDRFFEVKDRLDRPAQQASSMTASSGSIGQYRYLLWEVSRGTFYGEIDVYGSPHPTK